MECAKSIEIIVGPMFSGKSTELIRRCNNYEAIGFNVLIINHVLDTRCEPNSVQTHSKNKKQAIKCESLMEFYRMNELFFNKVNVIAIDESQFFNDLLEFVKHVEYKNIILLIAGLDGDCKRKPFGDILSCIPYCDKITKLNAMCMKSKDGTLGAFTKRISDFENNDQIDVGGSDKFIAVCRKEYLK